MENSRYCPNMSDKLIKERMRDKLKDEKDRERQRERGEQTKRNIERLQRENKKMLKIVTKIYF